MTTLQAAERSFRPPRVRSRKKPGPGLHPWTPLWILLSGLMLTALIANTLWTDETRRVEEEKVRVLAEVTAAVELRMASYVQTLFGVRAIHSSSETVTAEEFDAYVASTEALTLFPGLRAIAWNRVVSADQVESYEQAVQIRQSAGADEFEVHPVSDEEHLVAEFVSPRPGNESNLGFNILSEERRAAAVSRARAEDRPIATAPLGLIQDAEAKNPGPGILIVLPTGAEHGGPEGAAVGVFRTDVLLASTSSATGISFVVNDLGRDDQAEPTATSLSPSNATVADASASQEIEILGRRWEISLGEGQVGNPSPVGLLSSLFAGLTVTLALSWGAVNHTRTKRAFLTAQTLTEEISTMNHDMAIATTRHERGARMAGIRLWEMNLTTGKSWSSSDVELGSVVLSQSDGSSGISAIEFSGDDRPFELQIHPDDRDRIINPPIPEPNQVLEQEFRLVGKNGEIRWMAARSHTVTIGEDKLVIGAHLDVTERHNHIELVEDLNKELTQRNRSLDDFSYVAGHDLRSPLRAIASLAGFLREDVPEIGELGEGHLAKIENRVDRMGRLIDDLLIYARSYGREEPSLSDLNEIMEEVFLTLEAPKHLVTSVDCSVPPLQVARTPLTMCVRNLVDNAFKHHGKPDGRVEVRFRVADRMLVIEVVDDGQGIAPEQVDQVFEPFRRLRSDETTPGSGVGLAVIERAAHAHGGRIEVRSTLGEGSTFTLYWPYGYVPAAIAERATKKPTGRAAYITAEETTVTRCGALSGSGSNR